MHFKHSLSLLSFAVVSVLSQGALALPFNQPSGVVRLPLRPVEQRRSDLHPQVVSDFTPPRTYLSH